MRQFSSGFSLLATGRWLLINGWPILKTRNA
jgi:hypothetical protein